MARFGYNRTGQGVQDTSRNYDGKWKCESKVSYSFLGAAAVRTHTIMRQILDRQADDTVYKCYMLNWGRCRAGIYAELFK